MTELKIETPNNIEELKKQASDKTSYKNRLSAIETLGLYKCKQSTDILWRLMINDKVYAVRELAFRKLQGFGEKVFLGKKKKGNLIKDINKKLARVKNSFDNEFNLLEFKEKFKSMYPEEFDVYSYEKRDNFDIWIRNILNSSPK